MPERRSTPDVIDGIYVRGTGGLVQLANVVNVEETVGPKELNHFNRVRAATVTANLAPGITIGRALDDLDAIFESELPPGIRRQFSGQSREFRDSGTKLYWWPSERVARAADSLVVGSRPP